MAADGSVPTNVLTVHTNRLKDYLEWPAPLVTSVCVAACARVGRTTLSYRDTTWLGVPATTSGTEVPAEFDPPVNHAQPKWAFTRVRSTRAPDVDTYTMYIDYLLKALPGGISVDIGTPQDPRFHSFNTELTNDDHIDNTGKRHIPRGTVIAITLKNGTMDAGPPIVSVGPTPAICTVGPNNGKTTCTLQIAGTARVRLAAILPPGSGGDGYGGDDHDDGGHSD
jgi:hypothetical protein